MKMHQQPSGPGSHRQRQQGSSWSTNPIDVVQPVGDLRSATDDFPSFPAHSNALIRPTLPSGPGSGLSARPWRLRRGHKSNASQEQPTLGCDHKVVPAPQECYQQGCVHQHDRRSSALIDIRVGSSSCEHDARSCTRFHACRSTHCGRLAFGSADHTDACHVMPTGRYPRAAIVDVRFFDPECTYLPWRRPRRGHAAKPASGRRSMLMTASAPAEPARAILSGVRLSRGRCFFSRNLTIATLSP